MGIQISRFSEMSKILVLEGTFLLVQIIVTSMLTCTYRDGVSDDTAAINNAISYGSRCGQGCDSTTITPAIIYFPPGTYMVKAPIVQYYYTQFIGDAISVPTIKAMPGFSGIAVFDSDPYANGGFNWYTNQNNFFRQIRNFVIDLTALPANTGTGIHWQVAQVGVYSFHIHSSPLIHL